MSASNGHAAAPAASRPRRLLCERVLRNVDVDAGGDPRRDPLELTWFECTRRTLRKHTRGGRDVALMLPRGSHLRHGDVVAEDGDGVVVVSVIPCEVWVARGEDPPRLLAAALELGNLHVPVEVTPAGELICLPDGPALGIFRRHGLEHTTGRRRFAPLKATVTQPVTVSGSFKVVTRPGAAALS